MILDVMKKNPINLFNSSSTPADTLSEYELKHKLYDMMQQSHSFVAHDKHLELYNALMNSMGIDELVAKVEDAKEPRQEEEQVHEVQSDISSKLNPVWFQKTAKELPEQSWFNELVDAKEELEENELQNGSVIRFGKCMKKFLNKYKITKEDLKCLTFELLKGRFKNIVELEYTLEQCHLSLTDKIDWTNPIGNRFHDDLSQPLPLVGPPGRKKIPISYFFNHDLEYLKYGNEEKKYALSVSKIKAARYEDEGIKEMIPYL
ncbi:hypothetical protein Tco_0791089 [Tanacetum coccineum]